MFDDYFKKKTDKYLDYIGYNRENYFPKWLRKVLYFVAYELPPIFTAIGTFYVVYSIYTRIYESVGFERAILLATIVIVFMLRRLSKNIGTVLKEIDEKKNKSEKP